MLSNCSSSPFGSSSNTAVATMPAQPEEEPASGAYPKVSLIEYFRGDNAQAQNVPRPPATYTASAQPAAYPPPPGAYPAQPGAYPPASSGAYPPAQPGTYPAAAPAAQPADTTSNGAYPSVSLFDYFRGATDQGQNVPRPPSTYQASAPPYAAPGQPGQSGAAYPNAQGSQQAAQQPAANPPPNYSSYPQQGSSTAPR
jgi:hypothetical protein